MTNQIIAAILISAMVINCLANPLMYQGHHDPYAYHHYNMIPSNQHFQSQSKQGGGLSPSIIFNLLRPSSSNNKPKVPNSAAEQSGAASSVINTVVAAAPQGMLSSSSSHHSQVSNLSSGSSSSSGLQIPGLAAIQATFQRFPSMQSLLDASGITRITDPVINEARKRWQRIRTSELVKRVMNPIKEQMQKRKNYV